MGTLKKKLENEIDSTIYVFVNFNLDTTKLTDVPNLLDFREHQKKFTKIHQILTADEKRTRA